MLQTFFGKQLGESKHKFKFALSPFAWEHCDGSGFIQTVVDQDFAARSIQAGHLDGVAPSVGPVHVPGHPVYSQSICGLQALADHGLHATAVQICTPREQSKGWTMYDKRENDTILVNNVTTLFITLCSCQQTFQFKDFSRDSCK